MAVVVMVHGIGQEQRSADTLEDEWLKNLAGGVRTAGYDDLADRLWRLRAGSQGLDARMVFYGDLFLTPGQQGDEPGALSLQQQQLAGSLAQEWLRIAAARSSNPADQQEAARQLALLEAQGEPMGWQERMRTLMNALARIPWFAHASMGVAGLYRRALVQVTRYLTDEELRRAVLDRVAKLVGPETRVLIGHSLGAVVAYEAACLLDRPLPLLLTLGSPLGLRTIITEQVRPQPPRYPPRVQRWVNVADRDDLIAAKPDLEKLFTSSLPEGAVLEDGITVDNGAEPHSAAFYLTKREIGKPLGETLGAGQPTTGQPTAQEAPAPTNPHTGSLTASLWASIEGIYAKILAHPFLIGLTDGSLPQEAFRFYVVQDAHYLREYARALAVCAAKAPAEADIEMFAEHAAGALAVERALHDSFFADFGMSANEVAATPMAPTNRAYTSYLLATAYGGSFPEALGAVLPCYWIYWEVGKELIGRGSPDPLYQRWIDTYGGEEFATVVRQILALTDRHDEELSDTERERVRSHFVLTSRYEWMFWDMAWRQERWPV
jgi:thiaminase II